MLDHKDKRMLPNIQQTMIWIQFTKELLDLSHNQQLNRNIKTITKFDSNTTLIIMLKAQLKDTMLSLNLKVKSNSCKRHRDGNIRKLLSCKRSIILDTGKQPCPLIETHSTTIHIPSVTMMTPQISMVDKAHMLTTETYLKIQKTIVLISDK